MPLYALRFIETFDAAISLQPGKPIDPKDPIELIDLVAAGMTRVSAAGR
jgi:hypothetical protein